MTIANICKTILGFIMLVNIFAYPIGKNITNPTRVNSIFDKIEFEEKFLEIFEKITLNELARQMGTTSDAISTEISGDLISTEALKKQRVQAVDDFYKAIDEKEVPTVKFEVESPVSKFTNELETVASGFFDSIMNIQLCTQTDPAWYCETLCSIVNCPETADEPQQDTDEPIPNFVFETSLGIDNENIEKVNMWYKILKYGPDLLLVLSIVLLIIGYISSFPNRKFALSMVWMGVQLCLTAFIFWASIPSIVNLATPVRIEPFTDAQSSINNLIAGVVSEIGKEAFILPVVFLIVNLFMWIGLFLYNRYQKSREGIIGYDKSQDNVPGQIPGQIPGLSDNIPGVEKLVKKDSKAEVEIGVGKAMTNGEKSDGKKSGDLVSEKHKGKNKNNISSVSASDN